MPKYRLTIDEITSNAAQQAGEIAGEIVSERLRVTLESAGPLDHAAIIAAISKSKRVRAKRAPKVAA